MMITAEFHHSTMIKLTKQTTTTSSQIGTQYTKTKFLAPHSTKENNRLKVMTG